MVNVLAFESRRAAFRRAGVTRGAQGMLFQQATRHVPSSVACVGLAPFSGGSTTHGAGLGRPTLIKLARRRSK